MRLVHLADLHLGYRQHQRLTPGGINQREADVAAAFVAAIDRTIELAPEIVLFAGDIFQAVRPPNPAILHAFNHFARLRNALPQAAIVMIAGNHDIPRTAETGCILRLFSRLGIEVADRDARRISFPALGLSVLAVPDVVGDLPALLPDPDAAVNILVLHGEIEGIIPRGLMMYDRATMTLPLEALHPPQWNYIALGHYHVHREVAPNAFYAGAIEYTSPNAWGERKEEQATGLPGKGIVEYDLENRRRRFHPLPMARKLVDMQPIDARGLSAAEVDAIIAQRIESSKGIDDGIVRLVIRDLPRHVARELDPKQLRELRKRALHFHLDTRKPEALRMTVSASGGRRPSLVEVVTERLKARALPNDIDREALVSLAVHYLREVERTEGAPVVSLADGTA